MEEKAEVEGGLPVILRRYWRWVSPATEKKIEAAWGLKGNTRCQICHKNCPSHRSLRLHVNSHFLLAFCPCRHHDVYPYPIIIHKANGCYPGENHVVDADMYPEFLAIIRPLVKKALVLAVLTSGFQTVLKYARQQYSMVSDKPEAISITEEPAQAEIEEEVKSSPGSLPPPPEKPSRLATVEERLLWLQADFTQLAPDLLNTTTGLYQLKDSVGQIKRRLRARQAKHWSQTQ